MRPTKKCRYAVARAYLFISFPICMPVLRTSETPATFLGSENRYVYRRRHKILGLSPRVGGMWALRKDTDCGGLNICFSYVRRIADPPPTTIFNMGSHERCDLQIEKGSRTSGNPFRVLCTNVYFSKSILRLIESPGASSL